MIVWTRRDERLSRLVAAALLAGALGVCFWPHGVHEQNATALFFFLVLVTCGALVLLTRGLGARVGTALGAVTGLVVALSLARLHPAPPGNLVAFAAMTTGIIAFIGHFAGGWARLDSRREEPSRDGQPDPSHEDTQDPEPGLSPPGQALIDQPGNEQRPAILIEEILAAVVADFCDWVESEAGRQCCTHPADWSEFDGFVRTVLRERLGAAGVRIFRVSSDGERLEPLVPRTRGRDPWPATRLGPIGHVVTSGQVYVAGRAARGALIGASATAELDSSDDRNAAGGAVETARTEGPGGAQRWAWLLPLRADKRTSALVAVRRVDRPGCHGPAVATALRNQLQLFWAHLTALQALDRHLRTDCQSGMLNRTELLNELEKVVRTAAREGEPVMVLALAVEGLRRLDDRGRWSERDALVQRLGYVLGQKVRSDDLLGRFSDDRFVVVLRRIDSTLGTLVAEQLLEAVRSVVSDALGERGEETVGPGGVAWGPRLRAGLAGTGPHVTRRAPAPFTAVDEVWPAADQAAAGSVPVDGRALLELALSLLDYAREQRIDIATDLMKGLPERLARGGLRAVVCAANSETG